jgi:hypothetical protein
MDQDSRHYPERGIYPASMAEFKRGCEETVPSEYSPKSLDRWNDITMPGESQEDESGRSRFYFEAIGRRKEVWVLMRISTEV